MRARVLFDTNFNTFMPHTRTTPVALTPKFRSALAASLILAINLLAAPNAWAMTNCELNGKPVNTNDGSQTAGKSGMIRCKDADTGQTEREYELRNGETFGLSRYFRDGKLSKEFTSTVNGPHVGLEREWAANGQLVLEFTNVDGNARGLRRTWYDNGKPKQVEFVAKPERDGASVEYTPSQQLSSLRCGPKPLLAPHADDAALCGFGGRANTLSTYSSDGTLRSTQTLLEGVVQKATRYYSNGKPQDDEERQGTNRLERYYDRDGVKRREKLWSEAQRPALLLRDAEYHASGPLVVERLYAIVAPATPDGRPRTHLESENNYYLNGQPRSKDRYTADGTPDSRTELRDSQEFSDKGTLVAQGRYVQQGRYRERPVGVHQRYFDNGKLAQEDTYDDKGNIQRQRVWDEAGQLVSDDMLFEDGSRKAFAR
jgi:antitoxin component YwqK of YwqJK toxin-antitoxin module